MTVSLMALSAHIKDIIDLIGTGLFVRKYCSTRQKNYKLKIELSEGFSAGVVMRKVGFSDSSV